MPVNYASVGGTLVQKGMPLSLMSAPGAVASEDYWDFGWLSPDRREEHHEDALQDITRSFPQFQIVGNHGADPKLVDLTEVWRHPATIAALQAAHPGLFPLGFPGNWQLTGSCLPAGTPVRMADGSEKPIENVAVGDEVITHTGQARRVLNTFNRNYTGDMVTLSVAGFAFPLTMTADHKMAVMSGNVDWRWQPDRLDWVRAEDIQENDRLLIGWDRRPAETRILDMADYLGDQAMILDDLMERDEAPVANIRVAKQMCRESGWDWRGRVKLVRSRHENALLRFVPVCPSLARLIGLYLAEGGCDSGRVVFSFDGRNEEPLAAEVLALVRGLFGVEGEMFHQKDRATVLKVRFTNQNLETVFKSLIPGNVYSKRVPGIFFNADDETKRALIQGWMDGDGHAAMRRGKHHARMQGVTVSRELARDISTLALSCGIKVSVSRRKPRKQSRAAYDVCLSGDKALAMFPALQAEAKTHKEDTNRCRFGYCRPVKAVDRNAVENLPVYDFEVEEDHSFIAGGLTSSNCVGVGGGNVIMTLAAIEVLRLSDPEEIFLPWWPFTYGRSRFQMGDTGPGEGSLESTWGKAALEDGVVATATVPSAPAPAKIVKYGYCYTSALEMSWSAGGRSPCTDFLAEGRKHLIKTVSVLRSADEVKAAIINGYPVGQGSMYGYNDPKQDPDGTWYSSRGPRWSHKMSIMGWRIHATRGEEFLNINTWNVVPVWIPRADVEWICQSGEVRAYSQFNGYPAQNLSWVTIF